MCSLLARHPASRRSCEPPQEPAATDLSIGTGMYFAGYRQHSDYRVIVLSSERSERRSYAAEMKEVSGAVVNLRERPEFISNKENAGRSSSENGFGLEIGVI